MAGSLEVSPGRLLEWRLEQTLLTDRIQSSVFYVLDAEWSLEMDYDGVGYSVILKKVIPWNDFHPFQVTTWLINEDEDFIPLNYTRRTVKKESELIWVTSDSELLEETSEREGEVHFRFFCVFHVKKKKARDESILSCLEPLVDVERLSADLDNLQEKDLMPDVKLTCGNRTFPAHRAILASRSELFSRYSFSAKPEMDTFEVPGDPEVVELLLKYVYCGRLPKVRSINELKALYRAAGDYLVLGLKKACSDCIRRVLTEENCTGVWELSEEYSDKYLKDIVFSFVSRNERFFNGVSWSRFIARKVSI